MEVYETDSNYTSTEMLNFLTWFNKEIGTEVDTNEDNGEYQLVFFDLLPSDVEKVRKYENGLEKPKPRVIDFTTSVYKLINEEGMSTKTGKLISRLMVRGDIPYQLRVVALNVSPINGNDYIKQSKARVFVIHDALEAIVTPVKRKYTVSVHQDNLDRAARETAFSELSQIIRQMEGKQS